MPLTRATRKRLSAGEGTANAGPIVIPEDDTPSLLPPRSKRQRTSTASVTKPGGKTTTATAAAKQRKGRALKPVATNANSNSTTQQQQLQQQQLQQQQQQQGVPGKRETRGESSSKIKTTAITATTAATTATAATATATTAATTQAVASKPRRGRPPKTAKQQAKKEDDQGQHFAVVETEETSTRATLAVHEANVHETAADGSNPAADAEVPDPHRKASSATAVSTSSYQNGIPDDIDARDAHDPLSVTDYVADMYEHFRSKEELCSVDCMYMGSAAHGKQPNINESMRCILVDWLIEVHYKFKLFPETLYLTINVLDRFLAQTSEIIVKRDLQLVGVTALLVSAKYEEMYVPELRDLTYICDGAYTEAKILRMEENILKTLNYNVTVPTPHTFLVRFLKAAHADKLMAQLACFLLDGTLLSLENLTCQWRPSQLAAAAILLARRQLGRHNWSPTLVSYSLYREEDVLPVARALLRNKHRLEQNRELLALAKKYSKTKYGKVSHIKFVPLEYPDAGSGDESMEDSL